jgi:molybdenum cofactor cytidylyltransferase
MFRGMSPEMTRAPSFAGIILAAGESSRMGKDKGLLAWPPQAEGGPPSQDTFLSVAIRSLALFTDFVIVVAGKNTANLAPVVYANGALIATNPDPSRGQFSSLQIGLHEMLNRGRDAAMITLVDRPPAKPATIQALRMAFEAAPQNIWAVVPEFSGRHGHPFIAGRELIEAFLREPLTGNARDVERRHRDRIHYVMVDDALIAMNINTPADYAALHADF